MNPARALEILDDALALWRRPAFAEFADEYVARAEAACLEELRQTLDVGGDRAAADHQKLHLRRTSSKPRRL